MGCDCKKVTVVQDPTVKSKKSTQGEVVGSAVVKADDIFAVKH